MNKIGVAVAAIVVTLLGTCAFALSVLPPLTWDRSLPTTATTREANAVVVTAPDTGATVRVLTLDHPPVRDDAFVIEGQLKYDNVAGPGYLELTSTFADGTSETNRANAAFGPAGGMTGSSPWRRFVLASGDAHHGQTPTRIDVSVVLPKGGTVYLGSANLVEGMANHRHRATSWLESPRAGTLAGALGAVVVLYGIVAGFLASRGRWKRLVVALTVLAMALSCAALGCAIAGMVGNPARDALYPLALVGALGIALCGVMMKLIKRKYAANITNVSNTSEASTQV
jgi:hypothetical protein